MTSLVISPDRILEKTDGDRYHVLSCPLISPQSLDTFGAILTLFQVREEFPWHAWRSFLLFRPLSSSAGVGEHPDQHQHPEVQKHLPQHPKPRPRRHSAIGNSTPRPVSRKASAYVCRQYRPGRNCGHGCAPCRRFKLFRPINHHKLHEYCDWEKYISHLRDYRRTGGHFHREFLRRSLQRDIQDQRRM